jgi:hypothetical protein
MPVTRLIVAATLSILSGCAWVLPKASPPPPPSEAIAVEVAACSVELGEARKARSASLPDFGAAEPLTISLDGDPRADRIIRDGSIVRLQRAAGGGGQVIREQDGTRALRLAAASPGGISGRIADGGDIRLEARVDGSGAGGASAPAAVSPPAGHAFAILKADTPNPNRPSSCDAALRDGDFVYLRSTEQNAWATVRDGTLVIQARRPVGSPPCATPREKCYTDRYGGELCANYYECVDPGVH